MKIAIQSLHFDASAQLKDFIEKKVSKLEKLSDSISEAEVILKVVKPEAPHNKEASIRLNGNAGLFANKFADSFEEAVVLSLEALEKQIQKSKEKE